MNKNFWAIIISSLIISLGIFFTGCIVVLNIPKTSTFPSSMQVSVDDGKPVNTYIDDTYLSESEAAAFLKMSETNFETLVETGALNSMYVAVPGQKVFSKNALMTYLGSHIGGSIPLQ